MCIRDSSREAVLGGAFDRFAGGAGRRGTSEVDAEFLREIEDWREALARNLALRNPRLTVEELNDAVQKTIDRIVFLRMAEDRGMEDYGRLLRLADVNGAYAGLIRIARQVDGKYNSGLFDFTHDQLTPGLALDDKVAADGRADEAAGAGDEDRIRQSTPALGRPRPGSTARGRSAHRCGSPCNSFAAGTDPGGRPGR